MPSTTAAATTILAATPIASATATTTASTIAVPIAPEPTATTIAPAAAEAAGPTGLRLVAQTGVVELDAGLLLAGPVATLLARGAGDEVAAVVVVAAREGLALRELLGRAVALVGLARLGRADAQLQLLLGLLGQPVGVGFGLVLGLGLGGGGGVGLGGVVVVVVTCAGAPVVAGGDGPVGVDGRLGCRVPAAFFFLFGDGLAGFLVCPLLAA